MWKIIFCLFAFGFSVSFISSYTLLGDQSHFFRSARCLKLEGTSLLGNCQKLHRSALQMGGVGGWDFDDYDPDAAYEVYSNMNEEMVTIGERKNTSDTRTDEEVLEEMRERRRLENDLWQFGTFNELHGGEWQGYWTKYTAKVEKGDDMKLIPQEPIQVKGVCSRLDDHGNDIQADSKLEITYTGLDEKIETLPQALQASMIPSDFRGAQGNLVNKNTFSLARKQGDEILVEIAVSEEKQRARAILNYNKANGEEFILDTVFVCRESLDLLPKLDEGPLYGDVGTGIYDIPRSSNPEDYMTIYEKGLLTLRFPTKIQQESYGAITMDWSPSEMRYQVDRVFKAFDGSMHALEVIEISAENAKQYAPEFPKS
mmetsp:Transcript_519/g.695  ORF Transcript_519/g.695 Transcript_519/m.695 type:complete len:371 (-) Transcript_519:85-1197(-)